MEVKKHHRSISAILHKADRLDIDLLDNSWTLEEDAILYRYYPEFGAAECHRQLKVRTEKACKSRAVILKIKRLPMWTEEDNTILRLYYTIEGGDVYKRFNGRFNKHQCMQHARFLGLKATTNSADKWTEEDNEILRQYYPIEGKECYKRIARATPETVKCQAHKLGIKDMKGNNFHWTKDMDQFIIDNYPSKGRTYCAKQLGMSESSCKARANKLGVRANRQDKIFIWTEENLTYIEKYFVSNGAKYIANILGCTEKSVYSAKQKYFPDIKAVVRKVRCIETGEVFNSITEANNKYKTRVSSYLGGFKKSAGKLPDGTKLHWEYIEEENKDK